MQIKSTVLAVVFAVTVAMPLLAQPDALAAGGSGTSQAAGAQQEQEDRELAKALLEKEKALSKPLVAIGSGGNFGFDFTVIKPGDRKSTRLNSSH